MESLRARAWVYSVLSADATLAGYVAARIYRAGEVPQNAAFPYVTFQVATSSDVRGVGARLWADVVVQTMVWGCNTPTATLEAAMDRIDTLLEGSAGSVSHGIIWACRRSAIIPLPPNEVGGVTYIPLCAQYALSAQAA